MLTAPNLRSVVNATCRYFHDVWRFTPETLTWADITPAMPGGAAPAPRGGCQLALNEDTLFVFGGHSVTIQDGQETEHVFDDIWALDLAAPKVQLLGTVHVSAEITN